MSEQRGGRRRQWRFLALYSAAWVCLAGVILAVFFVEQRTFLYVKDGLFQHFSAYRYVCDYLFALLRGNPQKLGLFNYTIGQGADVLTTLNSYDFTDPLCWLTALLPFGYEARYTAMVFLKLYLIGLSFGLYCRETEMENAFCNALGAIAYCFSSAMLCSFSRHPNYINWAFFFPMMLAGGERYWRSGRRGLLTGAVFLNLLVSYYTFYMNAVLFALYVVLRQLCRIVLREQRPGEALWEALRTAGVCLIGVLLCGVALLPSAYAFIHNNRFASVTGYSRSALHYERSFYPSLLYSWFAAYSETNYYTCIGASAACLPAIFCLFLNGKKDWHIRVNLLAGMAMLCIPMAGRIMNGFGYASNRFSYMPVFFASVALARTLPQLRGVSGWRRSAMLALMAAYVALVALYAARNGGWTLLHVCTLLLLFAALALFALGKRLNARLWYGAMAGLVLVNALYQCTLTYSPRGADYVSAFLKRNELAGEYEAHSAVAAKGLSEDFYRIDEYESVSNTEGWNDIQGTGLWWSVIDENVMAYYVGYDLNSVGSNSVLYGLDGRTHLLETASVRYYTMPAGGSGQAPWGYVPVEEASSERYSVYENPLALPVGCVYPGYMLKGDFDALSGLERQTVLTQCVELEVAPEGQRQISPKTEVIPLPWTVAGTTDFEYGEGSMKALEKNGELRMTADVPDGCEVYLVLRGAEFTDASAMTTICAAREGADGTVRKNGFLFSPAYSWYVERPQLSFCLGTAAAGENSFSLRFGESCSIRYDAIEIVALPMAEYVRQAEALQRTAMENAEVGADRVTGDVRLDEAGILQLSIPWSAGWQAWVDGAPMKPLCSDGMYMALPLAAGEHHVELRYRTPWLRAGAAVSLVTLAGMAAWALLKRRRGA